MKLKFFLFFSIIWVFSFYSCGREQKEPSSTIEVTQKGSYKYGDADYRFAELNGNSKSHTANWPVFEDFDNEVRTINGRSKDIIKNKAIRLVTHIDSLSKKITRYFIE
jgi:hypothetical protein